MKTTLAKAKVRESDSLKKSPKYKEKHSQK